MKKIATLLLLAVLAISAGCGGQPAEKKAAQEITIGLMPDVCSLPFIIAQEKGFFAAEGIRVNLKPFKSAMDRDSALQSGNLDGAVSDMLAVAFAKSGGFDVQITSATDGDFSLIAGNNENIADIKELQGKDVAVSKNTIIEYVTDQMLASRQMTGDSVNKVVIPQIPTRLEMLQNGKLAAATLPEPMASIAVRNGGRLINSTDQLGINPGVVMFTAKSIAAKPAELQALYRAYNKAVEYLNNTPRAQYIDLVVEKGGFPPAAKDALQLPKYHAAGLPAENDVINCLNWLKDKQLIKQTYGYKDIVADLLAK